MKPEFIHKTRLSQIAVQRIKEIIQSEKLESGDRLPPERHLIGQFGISRTSIREALKMLETMGFIEVRAGSGAFITRTDFDNNRAFNELSQKLSDNHKFSIQEIRQRFEARFIIEPDLAALAAERRSKNSLSVMSEAISGLVHRLSF